MPERFTHSSEANHRPRSSHADRSADTKLVVSAPSRVLCDRRLHGLSFRVFEEDISRLTTWSITSDQPTIVVHLKGGFRRLETELSGANGNYAPAAAGEVWVVPADTRYSSLALGNIVRYAELHLDTNLITQAAGRPVPVAMQTRAGHYDAFLHRAVEQLLFLSNQPDDLAQLSADSLGQAIYLHCFREYATDTGAAPRTGRLQFSSADLVLLREFIDAHLPEPLRLSQLAALVNWKLHDFLIAFRIGFGLTPAQYIIDQRLRRARLLLLSSRRDITDIAYETGFSSHAHLSTVFRKRLGMTPREFRAAAVTQDS